MARRGCLDPHDVPSQSPHEIHLQYKKSKMEDGKSGGGCIKGKQRVRKEEHKQRGGWDGQEGITRKEW